MSDFRAKMHQKSISAVAPPIDPAEGAYSAPPDLLAGFGGPTSKERGGEGRGRGEAKGGEGRGGEGKGREPPPHYLGEVYAYAPCGVYVYTSAFAGYSLLSASSHVAQ